MNSSLVKNQLFWDISRSGQGGLHPLITRFFFNKVSENVRAIMVQYTAFFSPSVLLFQTAPPIRYYVPQAGVLNIVEYLGFIFAVCGLLMAILPQSDRWRLTALITLIMTATALIPTALTIDDFPNFQRGVYATPFWQMAAAVGWGLALTQFASMLHQRHWRNHFYWIATLIIVGGVGISLVPFTVNYYAHSRFANVFNRSRAGEELGKWVNAQAHDDVILMDHDEANFIYPYIYARENIREIGVESSQHYMLKAPDFRIGKRFYVHKLCQAENLAQRIANVNPSYIIVKTYPPYDECLLPRNYDLHHSISFDDGTVGYKIYKFNPFYHLTNPTPEATSK